MEGKSRPNIRDAGEKYECDTVAELRLICW